MALLRTPRVRIGLSLSSSVGSRKPRDRSALSLSFSVGMGGFVGEAASSSPL